MRKSCLKVVKLLTDSLALMGVAMVIGACSGEVGDPAGGPTPIGGGPGSTGTGNGAGTGPAGTGTGNGSGTGSNADGGSGTGTGTGGSGGSASSVGTGVLAPAYTRLTRPEYIATVKAAFGIEPTLSGIPDDNRVGPFTSNVDVSPDPAGAFLLASEDFAAAVVPAKLPACTAATASTCIPKNYQGPIEALYRRALTAAEITTLSNMLSTLEKAGVSSQDATREMVTSALMSPDFLFRATPIGGAPAHAQELTEQLSYGLWDAPPDTDLKSAAQGSAADLGARLGTQAKRLAKDPRAVAPLARFLAQWMRVDVDVNLADPDYAKSPLYLELLAYAEDALANNVPVTSFVNGTKGFIQKGNFAGYGIAATSSTANVVNVTWPATSIRRGIIGEEIVMDATRHPDPTRRPIFRGHLIQSSLLCADIPPPPPELQALAGEVADRTKDKRCMGCHLLMEPVGAAFAPIDPDYKGATPQAVLDNDEVGGTYADLPTLLDKIAKSQTYADCFSRNLLGFFLEQDPANVDDVAIADISTIVKAGGGFADAVAQLATSLEARSKSVTPWCAAP